MSEEPVTAGTSERTAEPAREPPLDAELAFPGRGRSGTVIALASSLLLTIALILLSPFWAPPLAALLPWAGNPAAGKFDALAYRVAALEQQPSPPPIDLGPIERAQSALTQRLGQLAHELDAARRDAAAAGAAKSTVAELVQRVEALAAQSEAHGAALQRVDQDLARRSTAASEFSRRLDTLETTLRQQAQADRSGSVMLLALLQMREAVQEGRAFAIEYAAFVQAAGRNSELAAAAIPLAQMARDGTPSRAALADGLAELARQPAAAAPAAAKQKWWAQAFDRLRRLVSVRRIDSSGHPIADPVATARVDLARGDLAAAVAAVDQLTGAQAEAAQPWLKMARERLAAEAALVRLQQALTARLGPSSPAPAATEPNPATAPAPVTAKTPS